MSLVTTSLPRPASEPNCVVHPAAQDPRMVARVIPGKLSSGSTTAVTTHSFLVAPLDGLGSMLAHPEIYTIAYKNQQDVVDAVLYHKSPDGEHTHLICSRSCWPVVTAREQLGAPQHPAGATGMLVGLPGAFIVSSINDTLRSIAANRLGVSLRNAPVILGGASVVLPNSPEAAFPRAQEVACLGGGRLAVVGQNFAGSRETFSLPLQEIIDRALSPRAPDIFCMRLLERTLRLAELQNEKISIPPHLSLKEGAVYKRNDLPPSLPILSKEDLIDLLNGKRKLKNVVSSLQLEEVKTPPDPFLQEYKLPVQTVSESGEPLHSFEAQLVARRDVDCVASIGWCLIKDESGKTEPYIAANIGARVALAERFRESHDHPIAFATNERHVEIVTGTVGTARTQDEIQARAISALEQETGLAVRSGSLVRVLSGFRSPGFSPDADHVFLAEINPASVNAAKKLNTVNYTFLIRASDVRDLVWSGQCSDLLLSLASSLVERGFTEEVPARGSALISPSGLALAAMSGEASEGHRLIAENVPALFATPELRREVRAMFEREGQDTSNVTHASETTFFSPLLPESPKPLNGKGTILEQPGFVLLMDHDDRHYYFGEFIPYLVDQHGRILSEPNGQPLMHSPGTNREMLMTNEAFALFGDAATARKMGIDLYEKLSGEPSAARIFDSVRRDVRGFSSEQELAAFYTMVVKGKIPRTILENPEYSQWRAVIRSKLLGYYVRDRPNSDLMYEFWKEHPTVAQAALDFCPRASANPAIFATRFRELALEGAGPKEGFNPFKAKLERLWRSEIPRHALNLALLKSYALKNRSPECTEYVCEIDAQLARLREASRSLENSLSLVHNMEPTESNLKAAALYRELSENLLPETELRYRTFSQNSMVLTELQIEERRDKRYFLTKTPDFHTTEDMEREIEAIEFSNFDEAGLPRPPSLLS